MRILAVTSVALLVAEPGRLAIRIGRIDFYVLPIHRRGDFIAVPAGIVSFEDVQAISIKLSQSCNHGKESGCEWRRIS
jgi:hypothetical protein